MSAILKRELNAYFKTPVGYVYISAFYFFAGFYFMSTTLMANTSDLSRVFSGLFSICIFIIPILTMRLFSEERRNKTDQALLTAPVSITGIVLGKFLAAFAVFTLGAFITIIFGIVIDIFGVAQWPIIFGNFIGLLLLGASLIGMGVFISSITENQIIAAVGSFSLGLFIMLSDGIDSLFGYEPLKMVIRKLSFNTHYLPFTQGRLQAIDVLFFASIAVIFIFLTVQVIEHRRWQ